MIRGIEEEFAALKYSHVERVRRFLVDPQGGNVALADCPPIG